jgi:hypothetical protein
MDKDTHTGSEHHEENGHDDGLDLDKISSRTNRVLFNIL